MSTPKKILLALLHIPGFIFIGIIATPLLGFIGAAMQAYSAWAFGNPIGWLTVITLGGLIWWLYKLADTRLEVIPKTRVVHDDSL